MAFLVFWVLVLFQDGNVDTSGLEKQYSERIKMALLTKPSLIKTTVTLHEFEPGKHVDVVQVTVEYLLKDKNSIGYDNLRITMMRFIGEGNLMKTSFSAHSIVDDDIKHVLLSRLYDAKDRLVSEDKGEETDNNKKAAIEKRCMELKDVVVKVLPKEPQKRN